MVKVKCGAIVKEVPEGSLKWYKEAGWKVISETKETKKVKDETDTKKTTTE